ncbi:MAG: ABC transporter ATP-binding protein [Geminicoccaceae bacterium]|nr:ABC transporter ATP-binding protein [Geminicoccaceae bacterium]
MAHVEGTVRTPEPRSDVLNAPGPLVSIQNLVISFEADEGTLRAIDGVSFDIGHNRTTALVGESGSGKTVISHALLGILPANARIAGGRILFDDPRQEGGAIDLAPIPSDHPTRRAIRGGRISIIFQEPMSSLSALHTIGDQIGEAYRLHVEDDRGAAKRETIAMLDRVGFPHPQRAFATYPFELSGGLRQRAMIAMALICRPALLIADEPTTALDVTIQAQILELLEELKRELGMAMLFITHDLGVVANIADDVAVLYRGRLVETGTCENLLRRPRHPYLKALLHAVPTLHMDPSERLTSLRDIGTAPSGSDVRKPEQGDTGDILEVSGLMKSFHLRRGFGEERVFKAVDDVSFTVRRGSCFAIVGESGSGKTTVSKMIMRAMEPDSGRITFFARNGPVDVLALDEQQLLPFRRSIQYIFQDPFGSLNPRMTIYDIVAEPMVIHGIGSEAERQARVRHLLQAVGLDARHMRRYPHSFSGGQRQRIGIARALALEPELLICDEPVSALDVSVQAQILNLLKDLQRDLGLTYLFISHNLAVVRYVAQKVGVMCRGRMVEVASTQKLFAAPHHPYTKALLAAVPEPDLDNLLDFERIAREQNNTPSDWPSPFALSTGSGRMVEIDRDHLVRMQA